MSLQRERKVYSREFKESAVAMVTEQGRRVSEVARDLGLTEKLLHKWKSALSEKKDNAFPGHGSKLGQDDLLRKVMRENARLKEECDILKKAAKFFLCDHG